MARKQSSFSRQVVELSRKDFPAVARQRLDPRVLSRVDEEDLAQHTAAAVLAAGDKLRTLPAGERAAYAMRALLNDVQDANQRVAWKREIPADPSPEGGATLEVAASTSGPESLAVQGQRREAVHAAIARLSPDESEVLWLRLEGRTGAGMAEALGCTEAEARTRFRRAMEHMKKLLAEMGV